MSLWKVFWVIKSQKVGQIEKKKLWLPTQDTQSMKKRQQRRPSWQVWVRHSRCHWPTCRPGGMHARRRRLLRPRQPHCIAAGGWLTNPWTTWCVHGASKKGKMHVMRKLGLAPPEEAAAIDEPHVMHKSGRPLLCSHVQPLPGGSGPLWCRPHGCSHAGERGYQPLLNQQGCNGDLNVFLGCIFCRIVFLCWYPVHVRMPGRPTL